MITFADTVPPTISCPMNKVLACGDSTDPANTGNPTTGDNCGQAVTVSHVDVALPVNCTGRAGIARHWLATDACGNTNGCVQMITFADTVPPTISCPMNKVLACGDSTDPANTGNPTTGDNCGQAVTVSHVDVALPVNCTGRAGIARHWLATDACGNTNGCVQMITFAEIGR